MKKYCLFLIFYIISVSAQTTSAIPTIAFPEPSIALNSDPEEQKSSESTVYYDISTILKLRKNLPKFSIQVAKQIESSGKFRVITPESRIIDNFQVDPNSENILKHSESQTKFTHESGEIPDYILFSTLTNIVTAKTVNPIPDTDKNSWIYRLDSTVDCRLVHTKDRRIVAVFTSAGHSGYAFLTNISDKSQPLNNNDILTLINYNRIDLAKEIIKDLIYNYNQELKWGNKNEPDNK